jgi:hypothetical protein
MGKKWPTTISDSWPFSMISWLSFGYHREKLIADFFDLSNLFQVSRDLIPLQIL